MATVQRRTFKKPYHMLAETINTNSNFIRFEAKRHRRYAWIIGFMKGFVMMVVLIGAFPLMIWIAISSNNMFGPSPTYFPVLIFTAPYLAFFLLPFLVCAPIAVLLSLQQKNMSRILVFRKFNNKKSQKALSRIIQSCLSQYGHTFTLADTNFKVPWYVRIPFVQGQLSLFHFRQTIINKEARLANFKNHIRHKSWLNINWLLSADKIFAVRSSDEFWQPTAGSLLSTSDLILFDVSIESMHMSWEMEQSIKHNLGHKIIAVCSATNKTAVEAWIERFKDSFQTPLPLFLYNDKGNLLAQQAFDDAVVARLAQSYGQQLSDDREEWHEQAAGETPAGQEDQPKKFVQPLASAKKGSKNGSARYTLQRTLQLTTITVAIILLLLFFYSPYLSPAFTAGNTPFARQAVTAFVQSAKIKVDTNRLARIGHDIHRNWPVKAAEFSIGHSLNHYEDECAAVVFVLERLGHNSQYQQYEKLVTDAEPSVAAAAARVLASLNDPNNNKLAFALQLLNSPYISNRLNAITILRSVQLNTMIIERILAIVATAPVYDQVNVHKTSILHRPKNTSDFAAIDSQDEDEYYLKLYLLLQNKIDIPHRPQLEVLFIGAPLRMRIFSAMLLAKFNDVRGMPLLMEARAIINTRAILFGFRTTTFPYQQEVDPILRIQTQTADKPPVDSFIARLNYPGVARFGDYPEQNHALKKMLVFVVEHYRFDEALQVIAKVPEDFPVQLGQALDSLYNMDNPEIKRNVIKFARVRQELLQRNLYNRGVPAQLNSAWLLARAGYAGIIPPVVAMANKVALRSIFSSKKEYPNLAASQEILEILEANLTTGYDPGELHEIKKKALPELQPVLSKLIKKCKGK